MPHPRDTPDARPLTVRLRSVLPSLTPAEARVAQVVLDHAGDAHQPTIEDVGRLSESSTATVVRLFQRLGYRKFRSFWLDLSLESQQELWGRGIAEGATSDIDRDDDLEDIVRKVSTNERLSLEDTAEALDLGRLRRAIDAVSDARRIDLFGAGAGAVVLLDLQQKLSRIGRTALHWSDEHAAWTAAATLPPGSVAIGVSHSGRTGATLRFLELARRSGAMTIAVTNTQGSPLERSADLALLTAAREAPFRSGALGSRVAQHLVLDCLYVGVAQRDYDASMEALRSTFSAVHRPFP